MFWIFKNKKKEVKTLNNIPEEIIFNVENFNTWFNYKNNGAIYAHSGIFLRTDKLSNGHIDDYILKCYGIDVNNFNFSKPYFDLYYNFLDDIRKDWLVKLSKQNK